MRKVKILPLAFLMISIDCFSQFETSPEVADVTKLTIVNPGISYEKRIGHLQTLHLHAYMRFSAYYSYSSFFGSSSGINYDPTLGIGYRYYYNANRRSEKGRRTEMNSMNYLGVVHASTLEKRTEFDTLFSKSKYRLLHTLGTVWGMQRNYPNRFSLDVEFGLGYVYGKNYATDYSVNGFGDRLILLVGVDIGFWLNKRK